MSFGEVPVLGSHLAFVAGGSGDTVLFLHGNPTWSFLWRRVLPGLTGSARCVAVDLIGMGRSGKPAIGYRFAGHAAPDGVVRRRADVHPGQRGHRHA
jgi:haloalkane dehalogenase